MYMMQNIWRSICIVCYNKTIICELYVIKIYYFFSTYLLAFTSRLVDMTMRVELLLTEPCDQARDYVTSLARSRLSTISVLWGQGLCGQSACSNVSVICPSNPAGAPSLTAVFSSIRLEDTAQFIINLCPWKLYFQKSYFWFHILLNVCKIKIAKFCSVFFCVYSKFYF